MRDDVALIESTRCPERALYNRPVQRAGVVIINQHGALKGRNQLIAMKVYSKNEKQ